MKKFTQIHNIPIYSRKWNYRPLLYLQTVWPEASVTPKLHMLEVHAVDFLKRWGVGFGLYGKQGAESIRNIFNNLHRTYARMKPNTRRVSSMMNEHLTRVNPTAKQLRPKIKRRKEE